jgi:hypothetical protein
MDVVDGVWFGWWVLGGGTWEFPAQTMGNIKCLCQVTLLTSHNISE